ncbi:short chain dehydrogenase [Scandinavium sp. H11S7]|uniref:Short chain dehydrogenase n=1 Tax=Scandinavium hiltneri TaxID=2926519 RepID=A0ABT2DWP9_9ENTR|nr:short chain dehydrogenase [Scandinavium hiltneri]MCS2159965.1 short chain dehydrogenase [Scandinavium hiltneri]
MKIVVVGASGTLGRAVVAELEKNAENTVFRVGHSQGDMRVDLSDEASVDALFAQTGKVDAIIATTGNVFFGPLSEMTAEDFTLGLQDKLLGQVRLALKGQHFLNDGGSITLTSGIIADEPIGQGVNATSVNAALAGFVKAAACELQRGIRINLVSPTLLTESEAVYGPFFPGFESVPAARVALAFRRSVEGVQSGQVLKVGY